MIGFSFTAVAALVGVVALTPSPGPRKTLTFTWSNEDLAWALGACMVALALALANPKIFLLLLPMTGIGALYLRARARRAAQLKRKAAIAAELPVIMELIALAVSAGESPASALARTAKSTHGIVSRGLRLAVDEMSRGMTFTQALELWRNEVADHRVERCIDSIILGYERGTSLNEVLHGQALDAREQERRALIEHSAKAEIAMMLPVVFLIMPVTILFALFPSLYALTAQ